MSLKPWQILGQIRYTSSLATTAVAQYSRVNLRKLFYAFIFLLTIFDAVSTWYGVSSGFIGEGNGIARAMFEISIPGTCVIMVVWTGALLWFIYKKTFKWIPYAMMVVLAAKMYIAALHLTWLTKL